MTQNAESFLTGTNAVYIAELYTRYLKDADSVDGSWRGYFETLSESEKSILDEQKGASWAPSDAGVLGRFDTTSDMVNEQDVAKVSLQLGMGAAPSVDQIRKATQDSIRALMMIRSYRVRGHLIANFDPLGIEGNNYHAELDPRTYGFTDADMDRLIYTDGRLGLQMSTLREILQVLKETYCGSVGVEYMHIQDPKVKAWIQSRIETNRNQTEFTKRGKRAILERLVEADGFENFLQVKYTGTKRFGLDGGESMVPAIEQILKRGGQMGIKTVVIGMPHRGRLNVLANIMRKPYVAIISEFQGNKNTPDGTTGSGDVKYHLGTSSDRVFDGNTVHLSLTPNPSHLEAVNPVVLGKVRASQDLKNDENREQVMGILMHGDAAFAGQGLVPETLDLSKLKGYKTGGTIHFIVNNQIGFTTAPTYSRSSPYPSDIAKGIQAPIFHINGDDPEAVVHVSRLATEFRQEFSQDVIIDMFCYRRHGHNEGDEPMFTQPLMYKAIAKHPTTRQIYADRLVSEGVMSQKDADKMVTDFHSLLEKEFQAAKSFKPNKADWLEGKWKGLVQSSSDEEQEDHDTSVEMEDLERVGRALCREPDNFTLNSKIVRQLKNKLSMIDTHEGIDWATAEALAFGTLVDEKTPVRLSGQDSGRGTFSHRHSVLIDQNNEERYLPLNHISKDQATYEVIDSPLSEAGVLGFEYGYSMADPHALVLWEGQFGDFANGAQVIIDQFIVSGETKWLRMSGLVMLLPHGFEGQGPEHSSARLERYLQLCAENNIQVVNCTTPAQYFHLLRRQMRRNYRKPLIVMSPKSLLRHKLVISNLGEMGPRTKFRRVLPEHDKLTLDKNIKRVVLCTGKVYYDLLAARREREIDDVAIVRIEQLYPFPWKGVSQQLARYPHAEVVWCQEEPANMGAWFFLNQRIETILRDLVHETQRPIYVGRVAAASPATGLLKTHLAEQAWLVDKALAGDLNTVYQPHHKAVYE